MHDKYYIIADGQRISEFGYMQSYELHYNCGTWVLSYAVADRLESLDYTQRKIDA